MDLQSVARIEPIAALRQNASGQPVVCIDAEFLFDRLRWKDERSHNLPSVFHDVEVLLRYLTSLEALSVVIFPGMPFVTQRMDGVMTAGLSDFDEEAMQYLMGRLNEASERGVRVKSMAAPYWSLAQVAYFSHPSRPYATDVVGPIELFTFDFIDRVIVEVDATTHSMSVVYRTDLQALLPTDDLATALRDLMPSRSAFLGNREGCGGGDEGHRETLRCAVAHCPVLTPNGDVRPLSALTHPTVPPSVEMEMTFGRALPRVVYYLMMKGIVSPGLAWSFAARAVFDVAALATTLEAREHSRFVVPLRAQVLHQLARTFLDDPNGFALDWVREGEVKKLLPPRMYSNDFVLDEWNVPEAGVRAVTLHRVMEFAEEAVAATIETVTYYSYSAILCAIHLKSLDLLGYFTHGTATGEEGSSASPFAVALQEWQHPVDELADVMVLVIELQRTFSFELAIKNFRTREEQVRRLVLCLSSLYPLSDAHWKRESMVCRQLNGFHEVVTLLHHGLRFLVEAVAAGVIVNNFSNVMQSMPMSSIASALPFFRPPTSHAAALMDVLLSTERPTMRVVEERLGAPRDASAALQNDVGRMLTFVIDAIDMALNVYRQTEFEKRFSDGFELVLQEAQKLVIERKSALGC